jgi:hypothetical protein
MAQSAFWRPDDRVLITSFLDARDIATDQQLIFVATDQGLEIYDQAFQRWLSPSTIEDGYPAQDRPARIAYDARMRELWLLTELQTVYVWSPVMQRWEERFPNEVPDQVRGRLVQAPGERDPAWQIMRNFAGRDEQGRNWRTTGWVAGERAGTFWASTYGGNFSYVDTRNLSARPYSFGTLSRGVSAVAQKDGQLFFGSDGRARRHGLTVADTTLQRWQLFEPRVAEGPRRRIHALLPTGNGTYVASDDGLFVLRNGAWYRVSNDEVRTLAFATGRVWAGTRGTLGWVDATDDFMRADLPLQTVHALTVRHDTVWVGAESGLYRVVGEVPQLVAPTSRPVLDLAWAADRLVMITSAGVLTFEHERISTPVRHTALQQIGRPVSVSALGDRVYIGGEQGVAEWQPAQNAWRYLTVPNDLPEGPVFDVIEENGRLWLATPAGAMRLQWR